MSLRAAGKKHAGTQGAKNGRLQESDWDAVMLQFGALSAAVDSGSALPSDEQHKSPQKYHFKSPYN